MQFLGVEDKIDRPRITANGFNVAVAMVNMQVGEIATSSFSVPIEYSSAFNPGEFVTLEVQSESANGALFEGIITGTGMSNVLGNLSYRVDLSHEIAHDLDSCSTLFPGVIPGSSADIEAYIKVKNDGLGASFTDPKTFIVIEDGAGDFWEGVKKALLRYIEEAVDYSSTGMAKPIMSEIVKVTRALERVKSYLGQLIPYDAAITGISERLATLMKMSNSSSTFWNLLTVFFAEMDAVFVCDPSGELYIVPNFSGIKADGNKVDQKYIAAFDESSLYERTPVDVTVIVSDLLAAENAGFKLTCPKIGYAQIPSPPPNAAGSFVVEAPPFVRNFLLSGLNLETYKPVYDLYALLVGVRENSKLVSTNLLTPMCLDVFPGVGVDYSHASGVKNFKGEMVLPGKIFDGYCWKITSSVSATAAPQTTFYFSNVSFMGINKIPKHPFWTGDQPKW